MSEKTKSTIEIEDAVKLGMGAGQIGANLEGTANLGIGLGNASLDASTPLVFTPTTIVVLHTPTMYSDDPIIGRTIKTLIESHASAVSGIDFGYTLETAETPAGHDGQQMAVPTQTKRSAVNPSFTFTEITGNLIWNLFKQWITDVRDPDSYGSMSRPGVNAAGRPFMASEYSMSIMAIQFDPSGAAENIVDAAYISNMFPTDPGGTIGFERNIAQSKTMQRNVTFTGHIQHNRTTRNVGIEIAKKLNIAKMQYLADRQIVEDTAKLYAMADQTSNLKMDIANGIV